MGNVPFLLEFSSAGVGLYPNSVNSMFRQSLLISRLLQFPPCSGTKERNPGSSSPTPASSPSRPQCRVGPDAFRCTRASARSARAPLTSFVCGSPSPRLRKGSASSRRTKHESGTKPSRHPEDVHDIICTILVSEGHLEDVHDHHVRSTVSLPASPDGVGCVGTHFALLGRSVFGLTE